MSKTKKESKKLSKIEAKALKDKENGRSYVITDFSFEFKPSIAYKKDFKEIVVKYLYKNKTISYYCFVRQSFTPNEALAIAKKQIEGLIKSGKMTSYAKMYYRKFY